MIILKFIKLILTPVVWVIQLLLSILAFLIELVGVMLEIIFAIAGTIGAVVAVYGIYTQSIDLVKTIALLVVSLILASITICLHRWGAAGIHSLKRAISNVF